MSQLRKDRPFAEGLANGLMRRYREIARACAELALTIQSAYRRGVGVGICHCKRISPTRYLFRRSRVGLAALAKRLVKLASCFARRAGYRLDQVAPSPTAVVLGR